jgi:hypothetical protein
LRTRLKWQSGSAQVFINKTAVCFRVQLHIWAYNKNISARFVQIYGGNIAIFNFAKHIQIVKITVMFQNNIFSSE